MCDETIASACGRGGAVYRALAGRLLTGPWAFLIAGLIDLLVAIWRVKLSGRAKRSF